MRIKHQRYENFFCLYRRKGLFYKIMIIKAAVGKTGAIVNLQVVAIYQQYKPPLK